MDNQMKTKLEKLGIPDFAIDQYLNIVFPEQQIQNDSSLYKGFRVDNHIDWGDLWKPQTPKVYVPVNPNPDSGSGSAAMTMERKPELKPIDAIGYRGKKKW